MTDLVLVRNDPEDDSQDYVPRSPDESKKVPWVVYAVSDERTPGVPYYIGITRNLTSRVIQHNSDPSSAAHRYSSFLELQGVDSVVDVIARFASRQHALLFEAILIATLPGLKNRDVTACRHRLVEGRLAPGTNPNAEKQAAYRARKAASRG